VADGEETSHYTYEYMTLYSTYKTDDGVMLPGIKTFIMFRLHKPYMAEFIISRIKTAYGSIKACKSCRSAPIKDSLLVQDQGVSRQLTR